MMRQCFAALVCLLLSITAPLHADHDISFDIGGRVKLDVIHNDNAVGGARLSKSDLALSPAGIPVVDTHRESNEVNLRESRLWSTLRLPLFGSELATYVEMDMFGTRRDSLGQTRLSSIPRLRHAYARYRRFTLGKTYTTFVNLSAYPEINDGNGPVGNLNIRQAILRYRHDLAWGNLQIALEEPQTSLTNTSGRRFNPDDESVPDLVSKLTWRQEKGNLSLAAMVRKLEADRAGTSGIDDEHWGGALSLAGMWQISGRDKAGFTLSWGNALGRYVSFNALNDGAIDNRGDIEQTDLAAGFVTFQHWWARTLRSNAVLGVARVDAATGIVPASSSETLASSQVNLLWSPMLDFTVGIEWLHGYRKQVDGQSGNLNRLQLTSIYRF